MADQSIQDLLTANPGFVPDPTDGIVVRDVSAGVDKASTFANATAALSTRLFKVLNANDTGGANSSSAQPWFPTNGGVAVESNKTYMMEGILRLSRSAGTTSHTLSLLFGGSATLTGIAYRAIVNTGDVVTNGAENQTAIEVASAVVVKAASTSATEQISLMIKGIVRVNNAGTLIPEFQYSVAPGGAPTVLANSYFHLMPIGAGIVTTAGTWS